MIRTRSALRRSCTVVVVLLAGATLAACGSGTPHQGSAAVVGGERISIAAVESRVTGLRDAVAAESGGQRSTERAGLVRRTVAELVLNQVVDRALADRNLTVTDGEIADAREAEAEMLGGMAELQRELLFKQSVAAGDVDAFYRQQLGIRKLAAAAGKDARTSEGDAVVRAALTDAGAKLKIDVNPRYGHWDVQQIGLANTVSDWIKQPAATA
ncbi:SurA N-terminal domain-containing protein [Kitasatospora sp. NPDC002040]|uniref:SurA N-terminal domain-containing protein n=1 Tax=Kitasatospora sp. NPDC002040 TaxID=3154661 RepID=UPI00333031D8